MCIIVISLLTRHLMYNLTYKRSNIYPNVHIIIDVSQMSMKLKKNVFKALRTFFLHVLNI